MDESSVGVSAEQEGEKLDSLIAVHQELAKHADARRQRRDAAGATLMTTAVALGAALITAAKALSDTEPVSGVAGWVAFVSLVLTLVFGGASFASILQRLDPRRKTPVKHLWDRETSSVRTLCAMADRVGHNAAELDARDIKMEVLRQWRTRVEIGDRSIEFKNFLLGCSGASLAVALTALVIIGVAILGDV